MFSGSGRNGKGKSLNLIETFLGAENTSNVALQKLEENNFALSNLVNRLANIGGDIDKRSLVKTNCFKSLTGRDWMTADRKFKDFINFKNYAKMIFSANELPITYDLTEAFSNRWIIIDFPYQFVEKKVYDAAKDKKNLKIMDTHIIDKLTSKQELNGLLIWAFEGLQRLLKNGAFSYSKSNEEVSLIWQRRSNSFNAFIKDVLLEDFDSKISKEELRYVYSLYCRTHKISSVGDKLIKRALEEKGVSESRITKDGVTTNCWVGIKFKEGVVNLDNRSSYTGKLLKKKKKEVAVSEFNEFKNNNIVVKEEDVL
jgi:putative DNA primase/helicase